MKQKKVILKILKFICIMIYLLLLTILFFSTFIKKEFGDISFEQLTYNITNSEGANYDIVTIGAKYILYRIWI